MEIYNLTFRKKNILDTIIDKIRIKVDMFKMKIRNGKYTFHLNYFVPYSSGFVIGEKIYYAVNTEQDYYTSDIKTEKKSL
jgi:hypothetical protein